MSIAKIIKNEFVDPRFERWKVDYVSHFIAGGFDHVQHSPAQGLAMYIFDVKHRQRLKLIEDAINEIKGGLSMFYETENPTPIANQVEELDVKKHQ